MIRNTDIVQIFAATNKLQDITTSVKDSPAGDRVHTSAICPIVSINGINIDVPELLYVEISMNSFIPTIRVIFRDIDGAFESDNLITNDTVISVYIAPYDLSELLPIRCDFTVTISNVLQSVKTGKLEMKTLSISGILRISAFMKRKSCSIEGTSFDALAKIISDYKLGFSSNIESTNDSQIWVNSYGKCQNFIESITRHSYIDDNSFLTSFIDWFYDFNFVEVNRIFTDKTSDKEMTVCQVQVPSSNAVEENTMPTKQVSYCLTNNIEEDIWNNYIENYSVIMSNQNEEGYRKYVQYYDYDSNEFISEYVDPITSASSGEIPISKSRLDSDVDNENIREENISFTDYFISNVNLHSNYYYADIQNAFNLKACQGFGLKVTLPAYNPYITLYSSIDVKIHDYGTGTVSHKENKDDETLSPSIMEDDREDCLNKDISVLNESLSGRYVITGIKIKYEQQSGILKEELTLSRREIKPSLIAMTTL